jgi:Family of unknown function (DUF6508)
MPNGRHDVSATCDPGSPKAEDLARIITTIIRSERFSDGAIAEAVASGVVTAVTRRAAALVDRN